MPLLLLLLDILAVPLPLLNLSSFGTGHANLLEPLALLSLVMHPLLDLVVCIDEVSLLDSRRQVVDKLN